MIKNLKYYNNREKDTSTQIASIETLMQSISCATDIEFLMGVEGNIRMNYYGAFANIINNFEMGQRTKQPPSNEVKCNDFVC